MKKYRGKTKFSLLKFARPVQESFQQSCRKAQFRIKIHLLGLNFPWPNYNQNSSTEVVPLKVCTILEH